MNSNFDGKINNQISNLNSTTNEKKYYDKISWTFELLDDSLWVQDLEYESKKSSRKKRKIDEVYESDIEMLEDWEKNNYFYELDRSKVVESKEEIEKSQRRNNKEPVKIKKVETQKIKVESTQMPPSQTGITQMCNNINNKFKLVSQNKDEGASQLTFKDEKNNSLPIKELNTFYYNFRDEINVNADKTKISNSTLIPPSQTVPEPKENCLKSTAANLFNNTNSVSNIEDKIQYKKSDPISNPFLFASQNNSNSSNNLLNNFNKNTHNQTQIKDFQGRSNNNLRNRGNVNK